MALLLRCGQDCELFKKYVKPFIVRSIEVLTHRRASSRSEKSPTQEVEEDEGSGIKICKR